MRSLPEEFDSSAMIACLADDWGVVVESAGYAALGGGSYHWVVGDLEGARWFVTVDDLDQKPWLGDDRGSVFEGLRRSFDTALALHGSGLDFVVAPIPTGDGGSVRRLGPRYAMALFPFVDGTAGRFGEHHRADRADVLGLLAQLHDASPVVAPGAPRVGLDLPSRRLLESALEELDRTWSGGPLSEPARQALADHASDVGDLLALADRLSADVATRRSDRVITHGEPHAANVIRTGEGLALVDWDTVALAPPERDLWHVVGAGDEATEYEDATGRHIDDVAMSFFRLAWDLEDAANFINELRLPHRENEDTLRAYEGLTTCVTRRDRWASLLGRSG